MTKHDEYRAEIKRRNKEHSDKQRRDAEAAGTALVKIKDIYAGVSNDKWEDPYVCVVPEDPNRPDYFMSGVAVFNPEDPAFNLTIEKAEKIVAEAKAAGVINRFDYGVHYVYGSQAWENAGLGELEVLADRTGDSSYLDY
jgi:hypothetical protein